jgi:hypothetical protein
VKCANSTPDEVAFGSLPLHIVKERVKGDIAPLRERLNSDIEILSAHDEGINEGNNEGIYEKY